jgi:hypothetical protein
LLDHINNNVVQGGLAQRGEWEAPPLPHYLDADVVVYVGDDVAGGGTRLEFGVVKVGFHWKGEGNMGKKIELRMLKLVAQRAMVAILEIKMALNIRIVM